MQVIKNYFIKFLYFIYWIKINAGQFIISSTNTCSRRRRETKYTQQIDALIEAIVATQIEP